MFLKNKKLALAAVVLLIASFSLSYTACSNGRSVDFSSTAETTGIVQADEKGVEESAETSAETKSPEIAYTSSSQDFDDYSFICPESWKLYETDHGRRVLITNMDDSIGIESIFIFVEDISTNETINNDSDVVDLYRSSANAEGSSEFFDDEDITIDGFEAKITGYTYKSGLDHVRGEDVMYTDYFTFVEKDGYLYSLKYISDNPDKYASLETFKSFLGSFNLQNKVEKTVKAEENRAVNILILGDDSGMGRPGGRVNGRTDIIILLHLNLDTCKGTAVTIPRDTWIDIPGHGEGKINGAHAIGGNELAVKTIEQLSGLEIDNYIITDFDGFVPLIDFLGGVTIEIGEDLSDDFSGCYLSKGVHHLDGQQALALSRNRHRSGDGSTQSGAFAREKEAAKIIIALLEQKSTFERIVAMPMFINYLLNYTWTDLEFKDVLRLIPVLGKIKASDIEITTIPSWPQSFGKASAVAYDEEATEELFEAIKNQ